MTAPWGAFFLSGGLLLCAGAAGAQEDAPAPPAASTRSPRIRLEEIVVHMAPPEPSAEDAEPAEGPAAPAPPAAAGISVRVLDREELERSGATDVAGALERLPAVSGSVGSRGERNISLRGFDQRQVLVMIDGLPAYLPYTGEADLALVPTAMVDHVTVVAGPGSVLYGPNGMGGAINLVTRPAGAGPALETAWEAGRGGSASVEAIHAMRAGPVGWTVQGRVEGRRAFPLSGAFDSARNEDGGDRQNSDRHLRNLLVSAEVAPADGHVLRGSAFAVDAVRGVPPSAYAPDPRVRWWRLDAWRSFGASIGHAGAWPGGLETDETLWVRSYDNLINAFDDPRYATQDLPRSYSSWYHDRLFGGRFRLRRPIGGGDDPATILSLWAAVQHDRHARDEFAPVTRTLLTLAPQMERRFAGSFTLTAGFQVDVEFPEDTPEADLDTTTGAGPLLSLRWEPTGALSLEAVVARRTRFPTLKERFSTGSEQFDPNPALGPEAAWHFGIEIGWQPLSWLRVALSGYDAEVEGLIIPVATSSMISQFRNVESARLAGAEVLLVVEPLDWLRIEASYRYLHARRLDRDPPAETLEYRPEHVAGLGLTIEPLPWLGFTTSLRVVGPQRFEHPETRAWGTLGTYLSWDARLDIRPARWIEVWVRAANLVDADYQTDFGFPEPGFQIWGGLRFRCDVFAGSCAGEPDHG